MIDFKNLRNSPFFNIGIFRHSGLTNAATQYKNYHTANIDTTIISDELIRWSKNRATPDKTNPLLLYPHLLRLLNEENPEGLNDELLKQWKEVYSIIKNMGKFTYSNFLLIQPPGTRLLEHKHATNCAQTLTFCYTFIEEQITSGETSYLHLGESRRKVQLPDNHKTYFSIYNNDSHGGYSNQWRFYWVNDFTEKFTIQTELFTEFQFVDLYENA